jgi:N-acetylglucosaminyldiphosphoundecaprenol N-acetyl-beta-D-mannosaminyltransferase
LRSNIANAQLDTELSSPAHSLRQERDNAEGQNTRSRFSVLGVPVDAVQIPEVIAWMKVQISQRLECRFIAVTGMHGIVEAQHDPSFLRTLREADLVVPDGAPLVWFARKNGYCLKRRVYGPELQDTFCRVTGASFRHFFYGGAPGVAKRLAELMHQKYGVSIAGTYSPPFRPLTDQEDEDLTKLVSDSNPDVLWVGLSTPKQERWMHAHRNSLRVPVLVGVGAAFDLLTGRVKQAPRWMRERGLEWLYRLWQEPRRLWRRYLIGGSEFAWKAGLAAITARAESLDSCNRNH